jgi:hypothetical protein
VTPSLSLRVASSVTTFVLATFSLTAIAACSSDSSGPSAPPATAGALTISQFDSALSAGTYRIEVTLFPDGLVAREVEVEPDDAEEKIESAATAIDPVQGAITLELGGLTVSYAAGTRFRTPGERRVSRTAWEAAIQSSLAAGRRPPVEARRNGPASPQAPSDPAFTAADLRIAGEQARPKIEIYVDADNLETNASPPAVAILRVLGLAIDITGATRLGRGASTPSTGTLEFEGAVVSVGPGEGTFTLAAGTVIRGARRRLPRSAGRHPLARGPGRRGSLGRPGAGGGARHGRIGGAARDGRGPDRQGRSRRLRLGGPIVRPPPTGR